MEATVFIILFLTHGKQLENGLVFEIQYMYIFVFKLSKIIQTIYEVNCQF